MNRAPIAALLACAASGCFRAAQPHLGADRTVDAAVPLAFGSPDGPAIDWDWGDGTRESAPAPRHAFARPGKYTVQASRNGELLGRVTLEAIPRPIVHALPGTADGAFFLPRVEGQLEPVIDFAERLVGPDSMQHFLEASVLASIALENPAVQPAGGIGLFTLPGFKGLVGLVAAKDPAALVGVVEQRFSRMGAGLSEAADGSERIAGPDGHEVGLLADRGYVYLIVPQPDAAVMAVADVGVAVQAIRAASNEGLEKLLGPAGAPGASAMLFLKITSKKETRIRTLVAQATLSGLTASVEGTVFAGGPLWEARTSPRSPLLDSAPDGFVAAASASVAPSQLTPVMLSLLSEPSRVQALARWGFTGADVERLAGALAGDAALLAYFDADAFYAHLSAVGARPEPRGSLLARFGLAPQHDVDRLVRTRLDQNQIPYQRDATGGEPRYRLPFSELPEGLELRVRPSVLDVTAGESVAGRPPHDLTALLGQRYGVGAFGQGHLSAVVDVGQLLHQLEQPASVPGVTAERSSVLQEFSAAFLRQLTPVDTVFLDVAPSDEGAHVRGRLSLRPR